MTWLRVALGMMALGLLVLAGCTAPAAAVPAAPPAPAHGTPLAEVLSEFYAGGPLPTPAAGPDTPSDALLDQVPHFPVEIRGITVSELLRPAYRALGGA